MKWWPWKRKSRSEFRHVDTQELVRMYDSYVKLWDENVADRGGGGPFYREAANRVAAELDRRVK